MGWIVAKWKAFSEISLQLLWTRQMNQKMNKRSFLLSTLLVCTIAVMMCACSYADDGALSESTDVLIQNTSTISEDEQAFYTMMVEYWIPDLYEIKGGMLIALRASTGFDDLFKYACQDGITRLETNIAEMDQYTLSTAPASLRAAYVLYAQDILTVLSQAETIDQTQSEWVSIVGKSMGALSMYASWLQYSAMEAFSSSEISYQEFASLPADTFAQVVQQIIE
jgi:hypothetical protein